MKENTKLLFQGKNVIYLLGSDFEKTSMSIRSLQAEHNNTVPSF